MKHYLLLQSATIQVKYSLVDEYLSVQWVGRQHGGSIMDGYEQLLSILQNTHCCRILDDHRLVQGYWGEAADWFALNWSPRAQQAGLLAHGVVYADNFFSRYSNEAALERLSDKRCIGFETEEEAHAFLIGHSAELPAVLVARPVCQR